MNAKKASGIEFLKENDELVPNLNHDKPVRNLTNLFPEVNFNIILSSKRLFPESSFRFILFN